MHEMEGFLIDDDVVYYLVAWYKTTLVWGNQARHDFFHSIGQGFRDHLIPHIA